MKFRSVLDVTAIAAYARGSEHVGKVLREFADEQVPFGLPIACLIEARSTVENQDFKILDLLVELPLAVLLPLEVRGWRQTAAATQLLGSLSRGCAALSVASGDAGYVMTREPDVYGEGIETIGV